MRLDDAYANGAYIPNAATYVPKWEEAAFEFRSLENSVGRARLNQSYGMSEREQFDLFLPSGAAQGVMVFIHGGYWLNFDKSYWSHFAQGALDRDWAVAMPSYPLAPDANIPQITTCISQAIQSVTEQLPGPIVLTGHSAGGHLSARMAMADTLPAEVAARVQKIVPISPVGDLRPLLETSMNTSLGLTETTALAESPTLHPKAIDTPVHVWVGGAERPVFVDQAGWLAKAWHADLTIKPGLHHFDVIDDLMDAESDLMTALLG